MVTGGDDDVKNIFEMLTCGDLIWTDKIRQLKMNP